MLHDSNPPMPFCSWNRGFCPWSWNQTALVGLGLAGLNYSTGFLWMANKTSFDSLSHWMPLSDLHSINSAQSVNGVCGADCAVA